MKSGRITSSKTITQQSQQDGATVEQFTAQYLKGSDFNAIRAEVHQEQARQTETSISDRNLKFREMMEIEKQFGGPVDLGITKVRSPTQEELQAKNQSYWSVICERLFNSKEKYQRFLETIQDAAALNSLQREQAKARAMKQLIDTNVFKRSKRKVDDFVQENNHISLDQIQQMIMAKNMKEEKDFIRGIREKADKINEDFAWQKRTISKVRLKFQKHEKKLLENLKVAPQTPRVDSHWTLEKSQAYFAKSGHQLLKTVSSARSTTIANKQHLLSDRCLMQLKERQHQGKRRLFPSSGNSSVSLVSSAAAEDETGARSYSLPARRTKPQTLLINDSVSLLSRHGSPRNEYETLKHQIHQQLLRLVNVIMDLRQRKPACLKLIEAREFVFTVEQLCYQANYPEIDLPRLEKIERSLCSHQNTSQLIRRILGSEPDSDEMIIEEKASKEVVTPRRMVKTAIKTARQKLIHLYDSKQSERFLLKKQRIIKV